MHPFLSLTHSSFFLSASSKNILHQIISYLPLSQHFLKPNVFLLERTFLNILAKVTPSQIVLIPLPSFMFSIYQYLKLFYLHIFNAFIDYLSLLDYKTLILGIFFLYSSLVYLQQCSKEIFID